MIRPFFPNDHILNFLFLEISLYDLLQDSLAIIKELLVLNVRSE